MYIKTFAMLFVAKLLTWSCMVVRMPVEVVTWMRYVHILRQVLFFQDKKEKSWKLYQEHKLSTQPGNAIVVQETIRLHLFMDNRSW